MSDIWQQAAKLGLYFPKTDSKGTITTTHALKMTTPIDKDGRPAFPLQEHGDSRSVPGMTLHDWFAGQALAGIRPGDFAGCFDGARWCYAYADAMIAASERKP